MSTKRLSAAEAFNQTNPSYPLQEMYESANGKLADDDLSLGNLDNVSDELTLDGLTLGDLDLGLDLEEESSPKSDNRTAEVSAVAAGTTTPPKSDNRTAEVSAVAARTTMPPKKANVSPKRRSSNSPPLSNLVTSEELQLQKEPIQVRETGHWWWKRILVPPHAYVVHTRAGRDKPVTMGLGKSFRYNSNTDAFLVVPAAMQTIGIVAKCITKEKQGINILAYLQWQISDFSIAYRKLDFSDHRDPLAIVNAQLREQAEAAIKDKIATMTVEDVLTDKAPIIEELTTRLKTVTEGRSHEEDVTQEGLGIKIVTVQIREAIVSSQKLWQDLQAPFRHQQEQVARISQLMMQDELRQKELENHQLQETREAETLAAIERVKQNKKTEALKLKLAEESIRFTKEQETIQQKIQLQEQTKLTEQASSLRIQAKEQEATQQTIQLREQTALARQLSEQQLEIQQARLEHEKQLAILQQVQIHQLEQARLENETNNNQKTLQAEQALHALAEENRLSEAKFKVEQQRLEQEKQSKKLSAELKLFIQEQEDLLENQFLEARLARQRQIYLAELEQEEASNQVKMRLREKEVELRRRVQEVRNLTSESDLLRRFIDKSAEIAAEMPDIHELKVLQTSCDDVTIEAFSNFVGKILMVAEGLGVPLQLNKTSSKPTGDI